MLSSGGVVEDEVVQVVMVLPLMLQSLEMDDSEVDYVVLVEMVRVRVFVLDFGLLEDRKLL